MNDSVYLNRELSWLDFNSRVLEEGLRKDLPPLERFRFFSIVSSNLDEFFMVRVAAIKSLVHRGQGGVKDPSGLSAEEQLRLISAKVRALLRRQSECLRDEIFPALAAGGLELVRPESYSITQMDYLESRFMTGIYPILTPLRMEEEEELSIGNLTLHAAFSLARDGAAGDAEEALISIIQIPQVLDRIIRLPGEGEGPVRLALLEDVALTWGPYLFPGYSVKDSMLFKINRDADFSVDEGRDEDFIGAMEDVIAGRKHSRAVRMVYSSGSRSLKDELARRLRLGEDDVYEAEGPLDLGTLALADLGGFDGLKAKPWKIYPHPAFVEEEPGPDFFWERIGREDILLELPYQSFDPVVRFFEYAAEDPQVMAIKATLYRTSGNSPVVKALEKAALAGKQVMVVVELKARFDEERNISWANRLERAGVIVVYGLARLKVHAKLALVIRKEKEGTRQYLHLSTGNYNDKTARLYGDLSLFTARSDMALDASVFFNMISGYSAIQSMRRLVIAPTSLKRRLEELIDREAERARQSYPGLIMAKMNALVDTDLIDALYRASKAGVKILLNVRGVCMLKPGIPGLSEHIRVVSVMGRYLEHGRVCYFSNGGAEEYYLSSADWMPRNLERRVELMFPILQEDIKRRLKEILELYFQDQRQAWQLSGGGQWTRVERSPGEAPAAQDALLACAAHAARNPWNVRQEFSVRRSPPGGL